MSVCSSMSNKIPFPAKPKIPWYRDYQAAWTHAHKTTIAMTRETLAAVWALRNPNLYPTMIPESDLRHGLDLTGTVALHTMKNPASAKCGPHYEWVRALALNDQGAWNDAVSRGRNVAHTKSAAQSAWLESLKASGAFANPNGTR